MLVSPVMASSWTSTRTRSPSLTLPKSSKSESGFLIVFSISRAIGRAPNARSNPLMREPASAPRASSSMVIFRPATSWRSSSMCLSTTRSISGAPSAVKCTIASRRFRNSGAKTRSSTPVAFVVLGAFEEAHLASGQIARAGVGRHDQDDVTEVGVPAVRVGQRRVIHHLQQDREQIRMRLLDFVEQQHRVRRLPDRVDQQAALFVADVSRRRADQARHRVLLHVLRHVEAQELDLEHARQLPRQLGLADAGRAREQEVAHRLVGRAQARSRQLDRRGDLLDRRVLPEDHRLQLDVEILERRPCRRSTRPAPARGRSSRRSSRRPRQ